MAIDAITRMELAAISRRRGFQRLGLRLRLSEALVAWLAKEGFDAGEDDRPLQRLLESQVVSPLARYLLEHPDLRNVEIGVDRDERGVIVVRIAGV
jgi:ATP-dependent Clp protease ATP-binding subunit ClpA